MKLIGQCNVNDHTDQTARCIYNRIVSLIKQKKDTYPVVVDSITNDLFINKSLLYKEQIYEYLDFAKAVYDLRENHITRPKCCGNNYCHNDIKFVSDDPQSRYWCMECPNPPNILWIGVGNI